MMIGGSEHAVASSDVLEEPGPECCSMCICLSTSIAGIAEEEYGVRSFRCHRIDDTFTSPEVVLPFTSFGTHITLLY